MIAQCDLKASYLAAKADIDEAIHRVLHSGWYILGEECDLFEQEFAEYLSCEYALGVASGTDAIELALRALDVQAGETVVTVSHTAVATVSAISRIGATPRFADVDEYFTLCPKHLARLLDVCDKGMVKAIIVVHLYGQVADMPALLDIANTYQIPVIEDCAQAHGAELNHRKAGTWGDIACFSFYPTKNLGALGDGGAVTTNHSALYDKVKLLRQYGWRERYISEIPGINSRLDELQAAILRVKLKKLDTDNKQRQAHAALYYESLKDTSIVLPKMREDMAHVFHQFVVQTNNRDDLQNKLKQQGIATALHYPLAVHQQQAYTNNTYLPLSCDNTEQYAKQILSLPMYPELTSDQVSAVAQAIVMIDKNRS